MTAFNKMSTTIANNTGTCVDTSWYFYIILLVELHFMSVLETLGIESFTPMYIFQVNTWILKPFDCALIAFACNHISFSHKQYKPLPSPAFVSLRTVLSGFGLRTTILSVKVLRHAVVLHAIVFRVAVLHVAVLWVLVLSVRVQGILSVGLLPNVVLSVGVLPYVVLSVGVLSVGVLSLSESTVSGGIVSESIVSGGTVRGGTSRRGTVSGSFACGSLSYGSLSWVLVLSAALLSAEFCMHIPAGSFFSVKISHATTLELYIGIRGSAKVGEVRINHT
jgi:hypothetical protein